jgi:glycine/D-amino acid oxidase-like deaminating enzyme
MFVTNPVPSKLLDELRIAPGLTFNDSRNLIIYGQRTSDSRIAFGGRGAPYRFGSKTGSQVELYQPAFDYLKQTLIEMFPDLREYTVDASYFWGGPIGVARNWQPSISYDQQTGIARAGNYVGDGVLASYLAGRTLANLLNFKSTQLINQPWVNQRSRKWEIEPLRYLFINSAQIAIDIADRIESASGKESIVTRLLWRILKG